MSTWAERAQATRDRILEHLDGTAASATSVAAAVRVSIPTARKYLRELEAEGVLTAEWHTTRGRPAVAYRRATATQAPTPVIAEPLPPAEAAPRPPASPAARAALAAAIEHHPELGMALLEHLDPPRVAPTKRRVRRTPTSARHPNRF